jgi:hypothetical protein
MANPRPQIQLGDMVKDRITGFQGVVLAITHWFNGCVRLVVQPDKLNKEGGIAKEETFDAEQVDVVKTQAYKRLALEQVQAPAPAPTGGPRNDKAAQKRR